MINKAILNPQTIAIVGASNNLGKPGGGLVANLVKGGFKGGIYPVNPRQMEIQGMPVYNTLSELPNIDLAIIALPARQCVESAEYLVREKKTKGLIIISAGFAESGSGGQALEKRLEVLVTGKGVAIIGPNCIGVLNKNYKATFISPVPELINGGVDFVSASGALAVFLFEQAEMQGLRFNNVFTVGNSLNIGVEEVLKHWDETYGFKESSNVKLVYVEQIRNPDLFFKHISSLRRKGCHVLVGKPGDSEAGARAALSHTGAMAGDAKATGWLIEKSGAIRCYSREEMVNVAAVLQQKALSGKRMAIITHAGGPAVMLVDRLNKVGFELPEIDEGTKALILNILHPGSSAINPIDMLATATKEQLESVIQLCDKLDYIDGMIVIYGKTGMEDLHATYAVLNETIKTCEKPVYSVLPSVSTASAEIKGYLNRVNVAWFDEIVLANALGKVLGAPQEFGENLYIPGSEWGTKDSHALPEKEVFKRLNSAGVPTISSKYVYKEADLSKLADVHFPVVAKVLGILHKTDVGGVELRIHTLEQLRATYIRFMEIDGAKGMLVQEMISGTELFIGGKMHPGTGYSIHFGIGGIFVEVMQDITSSLAPLTTNEAFRIINGIKSKKIIEGYRNLPSVNKDALAKVLVAFSHIFSQYPEIIEVDLNPLIADGENIKVVDARIIAVKKE